MASSALKLLTRSSGLQKGHRSVLQPHQSVPSSGQKVLEGAQEKSQTQETSRSRKRKRNPATESSASRSRPRSDLSEAFNVTKELGVDFVEPGESRQDGNLRQATNEPDVTLLPDPVICKHLLKKHKIKVTLLFSDDQEIQLPSAPVSRRASKNTVPKHKKESLPIRPLTSFEDLESLYGLSRRLVGNLAVQGYKTPTEVQMGSLPVLLSSNHEGGPVDPTITLDGNSALTELMAIAPTGSGKTLAFMLPLVHNLMQENRRKEKPNGEPLQSTDSVRAVIIAPTHELAYQIVNEGRKMAHGTGIKLCAMRKGMRILQPEHGDIVKPSASPVHMQGQDEELDVVDEGSAAAEIDEDGSGSLVKADIVVSTPLLFLKAISPDGSDEPSDLRSIRYLVLDEADVLLDPLFREQTLKIWNACVSASLCTSLWSATIGSSIEALAQEFILARRQRLRLSTAANGKHQIIRLVIGLKDSAIPHVSHRLVYAASEAGKLLALRQILHPQASRSSSIPALQPPLLVFAQTIPRAIALHSELLYDIPQEAGGSSRIAVLHSGLSEKVRSEVMARFRKAEIWVLITTDLLSRGVDFRGINGVVNFDIPNTGASYVHRVGRTGRQGRSGGTAITLYTQEDIPYVKNIANVIAAAQREQRKTNKDLPADTGDIQQWLLDYLPALGKKTRKELKYKGVIGRRSDDKVDTRLQRKMRISTKSGYDRRLENNKKAAIEASRRRAHQSRELDHDVESDSWSGIE